MRPMPIRRILSPTAIPQADVSDWLEESVLWQYFLKFPDLINTDQITVWSEKRGEYYAVKLFVPDAAFFEEAWAFAPEVEEAILRASGIPIIVYIEMKSVTNAN